MYHCSPFEISYTWKEKKLMSKDNSEIGTKCLGNLWDKWDATLCRYLFIQTASLTSRSIITKAHQQRMGIDSYNKFILLYAYLHCRIRTLTSQLQEMDKNPSPYLSPSPAMQMSHYSLLSDQLTFLSPTSKLPFDKLNFKVFWMSGWVEPVSQDHCIVRPSPINGQFYKQFFMTLSFFVSSIYYRPQTKFGAR